MRTPLRLLLPALLALALPVRPAAAATAHVHMQGVAFTPSSLTVLAGTTVAWDNHDSVGHTVTASGGAFDSEIVQTGGTFSHTFTTAGVTSYACRIHPAMTGSVTVVDEAGPDLVVSEFAVADEDLRTKKLTATVANLGLAGGGASTLLFTYSYGDAPHLIGEVAIPALAAGASASATFSWRVLGKVGTFDLQARADIFDVVDEAIEGNNVTTARTDVLVPGRALDLGEPPVPRTAVSSAPAVAGLPLDTQVFVIGATYVPGDSDVDSSPNSATPLPEIRVTAGQKLFITNLDPSAAHTLIAMDTVEGNPIFASPNVGFRATQEVAGIPTVPQGTYGFFCLIHNDMQGKLVVEPSIGG